MYIVTALRLTPGNRRRPLKCHKDKLTLKNKHDSLLRHLSYPKHDFTWCSKKNGITYIVLATQTNGKAIQML